MSRSRPLTPALMHVPGFGTLQLETDFQIHAAAPLPDHLPAKAPDGSKRVMGLNGSGGWAKPLGWATAAIGTTEGIRRGWAPCLEIEGLHSLSQDRSIGPHDQTGYQPAAAAMIDDMSSKFVARTQRFRAGEKFFTQNNPGSFSYAV